jgi:hypothetical protein
MALLERSEQGYKFIGFLSACLCYRYIDGLIKTYLLKWGWEVGGIEERKYIFRRKNT